MKILFAGGGTGGHILPIVAVARELRKQAGTQKTEFFYMGPKDDFSDMISSQEGIRIMRISAGKVRRDGSFAAISKNILDTFIKTPLGILQAFFRIFFLAPDLIFSKGGYGSVPSVLAGWILRVPIILHESDVMPGVANRVSGKFANDIFISFPETPGFPRKKVQQVGNPIREDLLSGSLQEANRLFSLQGGKPVILIMGGSQGSQRINDMLVNIAREMLKEYEIIHQTGDKNFQETKKEAEVAIPKELLPFYHPVPFLKETDLKHAFSVADLVVNRAGAGSIFEIAALGKPSILVPLPEAAQNHQLENAYAYNKAGACIVLEESNLTPHFFLERVHFLISNKEEYARMSRAALAFSRPRAAKAIAAYIIEYLSAP
ncbi:MAG: undecaprenyldiphospho-muramoylpentapeptide beta-N-acetylglucosaminyltransferase [Candidatus Wildermuthbacteria bacterium]|nr:undecaprenyldiphospho-muramoylpentapeptide beta-N-acetylglucosaminyltransferase [Candidatus Wildermuthbacteria bacterium]